MLAPNARWRPEVVTYGRQHLAAPANPQPAWAAVVGNSGDHRCNTLIAAGDHRGSSGNAVIADYNWYYEAEQLALPGDHDIVSDQAADDRTW